MTVLLALAAIAATPLQDPPRIRELLPNGSVLLVEPMPHAPSVSIQLFAGTRGIPEPESAHGGRHLLEHLLARGDGSVDLRLESRGIFLQATTFRDAMKLEFTCPPDAVEEALKAVSEFLGPFETSDERVAAEIGIMRQEMALQSVESRVSAAAWRQAYGVAGADPIGSLGAIASLTADQLGQIHAALFGSDRLALVIAGPVDLQGSLSLGRRALAGAGKPVKEKAPVRSDGVAGRVVVEGVSCEARAAIVPGVLDPRTTWALAAALAVAGQFQDSFAIYTPSAGEGLVIVGRTPGSGGLGARIDGLTDVEAGALFPTAKRLVRAWVERSLSTPGSLASSRGLLLCQGASLRPEIVAENAEAMTLADFKRGIEMLGSERAVVVVGKP